MKKLKLCLSLCTMCLCIAVLCIGVLSYSSAQYTIDGNITYNVADVYVKITTQVFKVQAQKSVSEMKSEITKLAETQLGDDSDLTVDGITYTWSQTLDGYNSLNAEDGGTVTITDSQSVDLAMSKSCYTYYIIINIENLSTRTDVCAYGVDSTTGDNIYKATNIYQNNILKGEKNRNIVMAYSLIDTQKDVDTTVSYSINVNFNQYVVQNIQLSTNLYSTDTSASSFTKASELRTTAKNIETSGTTLTGTEIASATSEIELSDSATTFSTGSQTLDYSTAKTYWIVSEITNPTSEDIYVKVKDIEEKDFFSSNSFIYRSGDIEILSAGETGRIVLGYTFWTSGKNTTLTSIKNCGYTIEIGKKADYTPLKYQDTQTLTTVDLKTTYTKTPYYYVEMGDYYGLPVRWKLMAESTTSTSGDGVYKYDSAGTAYYKHSSYTSDTKTSGSDVNGLFIQETNTSYFMTNNMDMPYWYNEKDPDESLMISLTSCSFNSNKYSSDSTSDYSTDDDGNETTNIANDYYNSRIRNYLNGTGKSVYQMANMNMSEYSSDGTVNKGYAKSSYSNDLNMSTSGVGGSVYSGIGNRTSMDIKVGNLSSNTWTQGTTDYGSGKTTSDKFWLLSVEEMLTWLAGKQTSTTIDDSVNELTASFGGYFKSSSEFQGTFVWLRSGSASHAYFSYGVDNNGDWYYDFVYFYDSAARAAFQLSCKA